MPPAPPAFLTATARTFGPLVTQLESSGPTPKGCAAPIFLPRRFPFKYTTAVASTPRKCNVNGRPDVDSASSEARNHTHPTVLLKTSWPIDPGSHEDVSRLVAVIVAASPGALLSGVQIHCVTELPGGGTCAPLCRLTRPKMPPAPLVFWTATARTFGPLVRHA